MSDSNSINRTIPSKTEKPYPGFALFPHQSGRWAKKIRGKLHYFGKLADGWEAALAKYQSQAEALHAGLTPVDTRDALTVHALAVKFLIAKKKAMQDGELARVTFENYGAICKLIVKAFGKDRLVSDIRQTDFARLRERMGQTWGPVRLKTEIVRAKTPFNWAVKSGLIDRPIVFGEGFKVPSMKTLRVHRASKGPRMFEADEIRRMLAAATPALRAMILLGVNCGFGNNDVGTLPLEAMDLETGWIEYARRKTGIERRCPLWPETIEAIRAFLQVRPTAKRPEDANLVFITKYGGPWSCAHDLAVSKETAKLLKKVGIEGHRGFYALRHTLQTIGDETRDFVAVRSIMGHADNDIASMYRERMSDIRLRTVSTYVREWLLETDKGNQSA